MTCAPGRLVWVEVNPRLAMLAVVVSVDGDTIRCSVWAHRVGRWLEPDDHSSAAVSLLVESDHVDERVIGALKSIRRSHGLVPYGHPLVRHFRVPVL